MDITPNEQIELILAAHAQGREDGFREAWDIFEVIEADDYAPGKTSDFTQAVSIASDVQDFAAADAVYLESTGLRVDDLEQRVRLIEQQYLGVDYNLNPSAQPQTYTAVPDEDDACTCSVCTATAYVISFGQ